MCGAIAQLREYYKGVAYIGNSAQSRTKTPSYKNKKILHYLMNSELFVKIHMKPIIDMNAW